MKTFEIGFKLRYGETSEWGSEFVRAANQGEALQRFARRKRIAQLTVRRRSHWEWEEGVWTASFRSVRVVKLIPCSHCAGTGVVKV